VPRPGQSVRRLQQSFTARAGIGVALPLVIAALFFVFHGFEAAGLSGFNPFNIGAFTQAHSESATQRMLAPFLAPRDRVTVVLIDDDYVRRENIGWPLSYRDQGRLFRVLLNQPIKALLIDLVYPHQHSADAAGVEALLAPIRAVADVPVIFTAMAKDVAPSAAPDARFLPASFRFCGSGRPGAIAPADLLDAASLPDALRAALPAGEGGSAPPGTRNNWHLSYVRWSGCGTRYPLVLAGAAPLYTPAMATYVAYCASRDRTGVHDAGDRSGGDRCPAAGADIAADFHDAMTVRWGAFPPSDQRFANSSATCQAAAMPEGGVAWWRRVLVAIQQLTVGMLGDAAASRRPALRLPCPAVTVVPLSLLTAASAEERRELLANRLVLVGASLSGIPDVYDSPVHGQVPGVVLHAMALDNLLRFGAGYLAERHGALKQWLGLALVVGYGFVFPFCLGYAERKRLRWVNVWIGLGFWLLLALSSAWLGMPWLAVTALLLAVASDLLRPTYTGTYLTAIIAAALLSILALDVLQLPSINWLGLVFLLAGFSHLMRPYYHRGSTHAFPADYSLLAAGWRRFLPRAAVPPPAEEDQEV